MELDFQHHWIAVVRKRQNGTTYNDYIDLYQQVDLTWWFSAQIRLDWWICLKEPPHYQIMHILMNHIWKSAGELMYEIRHTLVWRMTDLQQILFSMP